MGAYPGRTRNKTSHELAVEFVAEFDCFLCWHYEKVKVIMSIMALKFAPLLIARSMIVSSNK